MIDINDSKLFRLNYHILPGTPPPRFEHQALHDKCYQYWKNFWQNVFNDEVSGDDFLRQDFIPVVTYKDEIVAMHLYTVFNPSSVAAQDHSYFHTYPKEFFNYLRERSASSVMSIESLTVNPNWRKQAIGVSLGETLIGTSLKYLHEFGIDAAIAPTRNDRGVNTMCYNFGFEAFAKGLDYKGFEVDLVAGFRHHTVPNPNQKINQLIEHFWNTRVDLTGRVNKRANLVAA